MPSALPAHDGAAGSDPRPTATLAVARYLYIRALDGAAVPFQLLPLRDCRWETPAGTADQPRR